MKYTTMGRTGVKVSKLCLGTMNFGSKTDEKESHRIMSRALELGINFFDTADYYGNPAGQGITESIIGNWFENEKKRDRIVLATKLYGPMGRRDVNERGLCGYHIRRACNDSLKRLRTDHIDLYIMHHYDRGYHSLAEQNDGNLEPNIYGSLAPSFEETLEFMERLKIQDKISYIGSSNFPAWAIAHFNAIAREHMMTGTVMNQEGYSLLSRSIETEVIPACRELGVGLMIYSPLAGGLLSGYAEMKNKERFKESAAALIKDKLIAYDTLCRELGKRPSDVAIAWILNNKAVNSVIIGPRTIEQLDDIMRAQELVLPEDFLKRLNEIWPGPSGEAPECYAW